MAKILIVDDNPNNLLSLETSLEDVPVDLIRANSGEEALSQLILHDFILAIVDVHMPGMDGYELVSLIRSRRKTKDLPIIFLSAIYLDDPNIIRGYDCGAVDYLTKPFHAKVLICKVSIFLQMHKQKMEQKSYILRLQEQEKIIKEQNKLLESQAIRDPLTNLYNRRHFNRTFAQEFAKCKRYHNDLTVLFFDLDHFKNVNDTLGHEFGDVVIKQFSARLRSNSRNSDLIFRFGGEEFLGLYPHTEIENGGMSIAEKIRYSCETIPFHNEISQKIITVSIGAASYNLHRPTKEKDLIAYADSAMYKAKNNGRNQIAIYQPETGRPE